MKNIKHLMRLENQIRFMAVVALLYGVFFLGYSLGREDGDFSHLESQKLIQELSLERHNLVRRIQYLEGN